MAGTFHDDLFDVDGKPEPKRPWEKVWRGRLEAKEKAEAEKPEPPS